ncbi:site-specific integrase [Sphingomicrobium arenosum]|uniref:hypothetical protein n=1 Tax=Sphingomicrobium arenosum TaxID=2233861 RepID=UPI002241011F|nr:hypothetical protein [Sphingomicrobium arenosum]
MARTNLTLRGSTYWWRRQITVGVHTISLAISLRTGNFNHASYVGTHLSSIVNDLRMAYGELGAAIDRETLKNVFSDAMRWQLGRIMSDQMASPLHGNEHLPANKVYGELWRHFAAEKGELSERDKDFLRDEGWSEGLIDRLDIEIEKHIGRRLVSGRQLEAYRDAFGVELTYENRKILQRTILLARANANDEATRRLLAGDLDPENWATECLDETGFAFEAGQVGSHQDKESGDRSTDGEAVDPIEEPSVFDAEVPSGLRLVDAAELCIEAHIDAGDWSDDTIKQVRTAIRLFDFACGEGICVEDLEQDHVTKFYELCKNLPNRWGKTKAEIKHGLKASLTYAEELKARGEDHRVGLGPKTIAKHITWIGEVLDLVDDDGSDDGVRPQNSLRLKPKKYSLAAKAEAKSKRSRDLRANWTKQEIARLLDAPPLHGCAGIDDRFKQGQEVIHDGWYWLPIMYVLYGGRSAELAGLPLRDVHEGAEIPYFQVDYHDLRRLKNVQSVRKLPIHPELIRLGFLEFVAAMRKLKNTLLFPELHSPSQTFSRTFYRSIFKPWREWAFPEGTEWQHVERGATVDKDVHSFRGVATNLMKGKVQDSVRLDILGHEGDDTTQRVYDEEAALEEKLKALHLVTPLTEHLCTKPLCLRPRERQRFGARRGRPTKVI